ncbi:MAG: hypothetical protein V5A55_08200 [Halovenus sp.]
MLTPDQSRASDGTVPRLSGSDSANASPPGTRRAEEIHVRNFDVSRTYHLTVEVRENGRLVFANRYHLSPGKTASERDRLPPGEYDITVELDGLRRQTVRCRIDGTPERTALVQVGNGTLSLTEGLYQ